ncbi:hypothetical protein ACUH94_08605 [Dermabacteraceae bacterium P7074]
MILSRKVISLAAAVCLVFSLSGCVGGEREKPCGSGGETAAEAATSVYDVLRTGARYEKSARTRQQLCRYLLEDTGNAPAGYDEGAKRVSGADRYMYALTVTDREMVKTGKAPFYPPGYVDPVIELKVVQKDGRWFVNWPGNKK